MNASEIISNLEDKEVIKTDSNTVFQRTQQNVVKVVCNSQVEHISDKEAAEQLEYLLKNGYEIID